MEAGTDTKATDVATAQTPSEELIRLLCDAGVLGEAELTALHHAEPDEFLGDVLIREGHLNESVLRDVLIRSLRIPWVPADRIRVPAEVRSLLTENFCRDHHLAPVARVAQLLTVVMPNPLDRDAIAAVTEATGLDVRVVQCSRDALPLLILSIYTADEAEPDDARVDEEDISVALSEATEAFSSTKSRKG
jgi:type II secretion system (T2SS) protein E